MTALISAEVSVALLSKDLRVLKSSDLSPKAAEMGSWISTNDSPLNLAWKSLRLLWASAYASSRVNNDPPWNLALKSLMLF